MTNNFQGSSSPASFVPFLSCMSRNSAAAAASATNLATSHAPSIHAWRIVLKYYELKRGNEFNSAPQRKLSQGGISIEKNISSNMSFGLKHGLIPFLFLFQV